ncbi:MAG: glycoside hydrolase family 2 TIM barrel-domain containing protein [Alistipes onderdonkii]
MYYASQNHPSVVMFSLGGQAGRGYGMYEAFLALKAIEKNRPVIYEGAGAEWNTDIVIGKRRPPSVGRPLYARLRQPRFFHRRSIVPPPVIEPAEGVGQVTVRNRFGIANLKNFATGYTIRAGAKRIVASGTIPTDIAPGERRRSPFRSTESSPANIRSGTDRPQGRHAVRRRANASQETEFPLIVPKTGK